MAQIHINSITIRDLQNHVAQLDLASERIHELTGLFEYILRCGDWEIEQNATKEYLELVENRADAADNLLKLAVSVLLGPVADAIHKTKKTLEEVTAGN